MTDQYFWPQFFDINFRLQKEILKILNNTNSLKNTVEFAKKYSLESNSLQWLERLEAQISSCEHYIKSCLMFIPRNEQSLHGEDAKDRVLGFYNIIENDLTFIYDYAAIVLNTAMDNKDISSGLCHIDHILFLDSYTEHTNEIKKVSKYCIYMLNYPGLIIKKVPVSIKPLGNETKRAGSGLSKPFSNFNQTSVGPIPSENVSTVKIDIFKECLPSIVDQTLPSSTYSSIYDGIKMLLNSNFNWVKRLDVEYVSWARNDVLNMASSHAFGVQVLSGNKMAQLQTNCCKQFEYILHGMPVIYKNIKNYLKINQKEGYFAERLEKYSLPIVGCRLDGQKISERYDYKLMVRLKLQKKEDLEKTDSRVKIIKDKENKIFMIPAEDKRNLAALPTIKYLHSVVDSPESSKLEYMEDAELLVRILKNTLKIVDGSLGLVEKYQLNFLNSNKDKLLFKFLSFNFERMKSFLASRINIVSITKAEHIDLSLLQGMLENAQKKIDLIHEKFPDLSDLLTEDMEAVKHISKCID